MNVSVMTTTTPDKFKYPYFFKLLEQVEVSEVENDKIFEKNQKNDAIIVCLFLIFYFFCGGSGKFLQDKSLKFFLNRAT